VRYPVVIADQRPLKLTELAGEPVRIPAVRYCSGCGDRMGRAWDGILRCPREGCGRVRFS